MNHGDWLQAMVGGRRYTGEQSMSIIAQSQPAPVPPAIPTEPIWRMSVEQYLAMAESGILDDSDRVELLDGWLVEKMAKNPPHVASNEFARDTLAELVPAGWFVNGSGVLVTPTSVPEPDVMLVRGNRRDFVKRHPRPQDVGLVVEVADSSLGRDRGLKRRLYADAGVPHYWIANLVDNILESHSQPENGDYVKHRTLRRGDSVPLVLDGVEVASVAVADLLP